tara:strand:- start:1165 stop:2373 length:1209 start_codon:yes stop_codon:yes gene_type:complete
MNTHSDFISQVDDFSSELLALRRHIHAHPELSGQEHQTAALVAGELRKYGWRVKEGIGRTGVIAEIGSHDLPLIGLRVDMDALPIQELTELDYQSQYQGVMHACGHDFHTCIGLGVAKVLPEYVQSFKRGVRLIFQPAEEIALGASWMRSEGASNNLEALFGVHVFPELPVGSIGLKSGSLTAAAGELEIEVIGETGHGARPHEAIDAIWVASKIVSGLQEAISRRLDALEPVVISFGKIEGGKAFNVIANKVRLLGTVRCLDDSLHHTLPKWIKDTVRIIAESYGAKVVVNYRCIASSVYNDPELTNLVESSSIPLLGKDKVIRLDKPSLGAEDFAEFLKDTKGIMFRLGVSSNEKCASLHSGYFAPDERCLGIGIKVLLASIFSWMNQFESNNCVTKTES